MTQMARIIEYKDALIRIFRILRMTRIKQYRQKNEANI